MVTITFRDLQYRWRQFAIAVVGAAVAFALTLVLSGISAGFRAEARDMVQSFGASPWIVARGVTGPFTSSATLPESLARRIAHRQHVEAHPIVLLRDTARIRGRKAPTVNIVGHSIGRRGDPLWGRRAPRLRSGDVVVDARLHAKRGTVIISAVTYLTAQERLNDFAVLKAVGGGTRSLAVSLALEAIASALLAAAVGIGVAQALAPSFPSRVSITAITYLELPLIAIVVGMVSSAVPLRRAIAVDPTLAFGG